MVFNWNVSFCFLVLNCKQMCNQLPSYSFFFKASFDRSILMTSSWQTQNISCKIITFQVFSKYRFFWGYSFQINIQRKRSLLYVLFCWLSNIVPSFPLIAVMSVCVWVMFLFTLQSVLRVFVGCVVCDCDCVKSWECLMRVCFCVVYIDLNNFTVSAIFSLLFAVCFYLVL